jgi:hypothetical protein
MVTDRLTSSIFEDIHSIYDLAYLMEEVRIMYKRDVKVSIDNIQIDAKEGDISSIRRWIAKILSQDVCRSFPSGETTPRPVTTTRFSVQLLAIK